VPVKFGIYISNAKNGLIESFNGELMDQVDITTVDSLS